MPDTQARMDFKIGPVTPANKLGYQAPACVWGPVRCIETWGFDPE